MRHKIQGSKICERVLHNQIGISDNYRINSVIWLITCSEVNSYFEFKLLSSYSSYHIISIVLLDFLIFGWSRYKWWTVFGEQKTFRKYLFLGNTLTCRRVYKRTTERKTEHYLHKVLQTRNHLQVSSRSTVLLLSLSLATSTSLFS